MKCVMALFLFVFSLPMTASAQIRSEFVSYGDLEWRDNNFAGRGFQSHLGLNSESHLLLGDRAHAANFRPYLKLNLALSSGNISVENTATYGVGVEIRPLAYIRSLAGRPELEWLMNGRIYAEYTGQSFFRGANPHFNPRQDLQIGFDNWKQFGAADQAKADRGERLWAELFLGAAFHTTDFYLRDNNAVRFGLNVRAGTSYGKRLQPIMPYLVLDLNTDSHPYSWKNRMWGGLGVRKEWRISDSKKLWLFAEYRWMLVYLKDLPKPTDGVPWSDFVVGIGYQINRY